LIGQKYNNRFGVFKMESF